MVIIFCQFTVNILMAVLRLSVTQLGTTTGNIQVENACRKARIAIAKGSTYSVIRSI